MKPYAQASQQNSCTQNLRSTNSITLCAKIVATSSRRSLKTNSSPYQLTRLRFALHTILFYPPLFSSREAVQEFYHKTKTAFFSS